jgi:hypothetical protein
VGRLVFGRFGGFSRFVGLLSAAFAATLGHLQLLDQGRPGRGVDLVRVALK